MKSSEDLGGDSTGTRGPRGAAWRLALGATIISFAPILVKSVGRGSGSMETIGPTAIAFWRTLFGGLLLLAWCLRKGTLPVSRRAFTWAVLAGLVLALDLTVWHVSIGLCGAGLSTLLGNTQIFWTTIFARVVFGEAIAGRFYAAALAAFGGVALLARAFDDLEPNEGYWLGVALGLATGVLYAILVVVIKSSGGARVGRPDPVAFMACCTLTAAASLAPATLAIEGQLLATEPMSYVKMAALGFSAQGVGWILISTSIRWLATSRAGLILLLQPALALGWAALLFGETLDGLQCFGAALTFGGIYLGGLRDRSPRGEPRALRL